MVQWSVTQSGNRELCSVYTTSLFTGESEFIEGHKIDHGVHVYAISLLSSAH